jgi:prepilin-type N-terminal cleavage/methylation domain-containing protein
MKLTLKRKKGFTLLEIIIVVIIVGVLASLALPRLFSTVEYSRSTEALASMGSIRGSMERCSLKSGIGSYAACTNFTTQLDIANPGLEAGTHFTYAITPNAAVGYTIVATRNTLDGGIATSTITMLKNATQITRTGATAFSKL